MIRPCPRCGTRPQPGWRTRVGLASELLVNRAQAEEAMDWFTVNYPDPWPVILARREALNRELHPRQQAITASA
jgi:hypothetical protein